MNLNEQRTNDIMHDHFVMPGFVCPPSQILYAMIYIITEQLQPLLPHLLSIPPIFLPSLFLPAPL